jgi:FAD/FMN-containing dehydrogenase
MQETCVTPTEFRQFAGELIWPDDTRYDAVRSVFNTKIDMRPALVARCRGNADVIEALRWARARDLEVAVRCSGHNYNGFGASEGGVVIDLALMRGAWIQAESATARVGGGTRNGDILRDAALFDLAPATGVMTDTGMGLMLGGGFGNLRNRAGWSADNIVGADLVTADAELIRVSVDENPDLLWALRGAGANFGVATALDVQLHTMPARIMTGTLIFGEHRLEAGMQAIREASAGASEDLSITAWLKLADDPDAGEPLSAETPPVEMRDKPCLEVTYCHWGPPAVATAELDALRSAFGADYHAVGTTSYVDFHHRWAAVPTRVTWDAVSVSVLDDAAIAVLADLTRSVRQPRALRMIELFDQRGALAREPAIPSAQPRAIDSAWSVRPGVNSDDPSLDQVNDEWLQGVMAAVLATPSGIPDACALNSTSFIPDEARVRTHYGDNLGRLVDLKRTWDPDNVFRKNQNIDPAWSVPSAR